MTESSRDIDDEIETAGRLFTGIKGVLEWFETRTSRKARAVSLAVDAISIAASETSNYADAIASCASKEEREDLPDRAQELGALWANAASKVEALDPDLARNCDVKAYGWRTKWRDDEDFDQLALRAGTVMSRALALRSDPTSKKGAEE